MNLLILSKYTSMGASSRLRTHQYIPYLEENGIKIEVNSLFDDKYLTSFYKKEKISKIHLLKLFFKRICILLTLKKYDLIWIEKEILPYFPSIFEFLLNKFNIKYVVDYDDAIFHNYDQSKNKIIRYFLSNKISKVMKYSERVFVGNQYLYEYAERSNSNMIKLIPTVVDIDKYKIKQSYKTNVINIGWIGTPYTQKYLIELKDVFIKLQKEFDIKVSIIGGNTIISDIFRNINHEIIPWSEETEANLISKFDIGIMPLPNAPFEKGKCGYKLIQYMATGIPVIATPVGVNVDIINKSNSGFLSDSFEEWYNNIKTLILNENIRMELGRNGRSSVEKNYSLQVYQKKIFEIFTEDN